MLTEPTERERLKSIETAEQYLGEAENALWTLASDGSGDELDRQVEELMQQLWEIQHSLHDLQREFDE